MIKKIFENEIVSPKEWAKDMLLSDIELATDWYYERHEKEWNLMTDKEKEAVRKQIDAYHNRFLKVLGR